MGGGPIDVRAGPVETRLFPTMAEATRAFDGVPVRELAPLDAAVASCLVGDFVGDYQAESSQHAIFGSSTGR